MASSPDVQQKMMDFKIGDYVDVRKHGKATIIDGPCLNPEDRFYLRYRVQFEEDNTSYWVTLPRLRKMNPANNRCLVTFHTSDYRQAAVHNTQRSDVCLEIGCHAGVTTNIISNRCNCVVGVDTSEPVIEQARAKFPHLRFAVLDGNDISGAAALVQQQQEQKLQQQQQQQQEEHQPRPPFSRVFVDISGQAPLTAIVPLLLRWLRVLGPFEEQKGAQLIVKNRALYRFLVESKHLEQSQPFSNQQPRSSSQLPASCFGDGSPTDVQGFEQLSMDGADSEGGATEREDTALERGSAEAACAERDPELLTALEELRKHCATFDPQ